VQLTLSVDGHPFTAYRADGVIVAADRLDGVFVVGGGPS
jgi:hypothetical protein